MPHHLDAASFLNTKTMCLITNYYINCHHQHKLGSGRKADS